MPRSAPKPAILMDEEAIAPSTSVVPFVFERHGAIPIVPAIAGGVPQELRAEIARVFGAAVLADPSKVAAVATVTREFRHQGQKILLAAVCMGRALIALRDAVGVAAMVRGMRESRMIFCGWSAGNLSKMMKVAHFVDSGNFPLETLPQNWSTTYELTTLDGLQLEQARAGDLLRPDVTRAQLQEFKRRMPVLAAAPLADELSIEEVQLSLATARRRHDRLAARLNASKVEMKALEDRLSRMGVKIRRA